MTGRARSFLAAVPLALIAGGSPTGAAAEAWPREPGTTFLSFGIETGADNWRSLYAERGVTPRWTAGFEAGRDDAAQAFAFVRRGVGSLEGSSRVSLTLRMGVETDDGRTHGAVAPGAALGRGIPTPFGDGWAEAAARLEVGGETERAKLDLTLGTAFGDSGRLAILQWRLESDGEGEGSARIAASTVGRLRDGLRLELGAVADPDLSDPALKAALWWEF